MSSKSTVSYSHGFGPEVQSIDDVRETILPESLTDSGLHDITACEAVLPDQTAASSTAQTSVGPAAAPRGVWHTLNVRAYRGGVKRCLDVLLGWLLLLLALPVLTVIWLAVRLTSKGPAVFAQNRVGLNGEQFRMLKFRSMYIDHETRVDMEEIRRMEADGCVYKSPSDPRVTPVGRLIRKTSLDELPQLWNVIRGDMSLIGPRPLVPHMLDPYPAAKQVRSRLRPGITGLWQVTGRKNNTSVLGMISYDSAYVANYSLTGDLIILLKTPLAVFVGEGAE